MNERQFLKFAPADGTRVAFLAILETSILAGFLGSPSDNEVAKIKSE